MLREDKYFRTLTEEELWQRYCGFLDLSIDDFMNIQNELLMNQIAQIADSPLGRKIMGSQKPNSMEEFRQNIPITTYQDYEPYLSERQEDALAVKPLDWCHSSGRGGEFKWIPYSKEALDVISRLFVGYLILAAASNKGEVRIKPGERVVMHIPPRPYLSGTLLYHTAQAFTVQIIPPFEEAENMEFQDRIQRGFQMALEKGVDEMASISSVMVKVGERMAEVAQGMNFSLGMLKPRVLYTIARAFILSKMQKRPMLPKDLWHPKSIITGGTDTSIYKDLVTYYWGKTPFEMYGSTELVTIACQNWNKKWMTCIPYTALLEFIPEEDSLKLREDESYQPKTILYNELEEGKIYEVVFTHYYGMPLLRYRLKDLIQVVALGDDETGVKLPQILFHSRVGETIDLAGLTRLTERVLWQAIDNTGVKQEDWSACKEYDQDRTYLRIYIELKEERDVKEIEELVDKQLKVVDLDYRDIAAYLDFQPVRVTVLSKGTFTRYYQEKVKEGADLAHLKPPHVNASTEAIQQLIALSKQG